MAQPRSGPGNLLKLGAASSPYAPQTVGLVGDIDGPNRSANTHDVTSQDTTGGYRQIKPALKEGGTVSFPVWFDANDTQHVSLNTIYENDEQRYYEIHFAESSPGKLLKFMAYITEFGFGFPIDGVIEGSITLTINGKVDLV